MPIVKSVMLIKYNSQRIKAHDRLTVDTTARLKDKNVTGSWKTYLSGISELMRKLN